MQVTVEIPNALLRELTAKSALEGSTLDHLILALVEHGLRGNGDKLVWRNKRSPLPTVSLNRPLALRRFTNAHLCDLMDD